MAYKQQKPLREGIRVEQPNEPSHHPIRQKNLDRNFQPMSDIEGGYFLRQKRDKPQDNSHTASIDISLDDSVYIEDDAGFERVLDYYECD